MQTESLQLEFLIKPLYVWTRALLCVNITRGIGLLLQRKSKRHFSSFLLLCVELIDTSGTKTQLAVLSNQPKSDMTTV